MLVLLDLLYPGRTWAAARATASRPASWPEGLVRQRIGRADAREKLV